MRSKRSGVPCRNGLTVLGVALFLLTLGYAGGVQAQETKPQMYVSMRDAMLAESTFPTIAEGLRHLGVNALELNLARDFSVRKLEASGKAILDTDADVQAYRTRADALGIRICSILTACDFSAGEMNANCAWIARAIEIAALLGADSVRVDSAMAKERSLDFQTRVDLFAQGLGGALARTPNTNVTLGIENHGFQGNNLAFLLNVFHTVNDERLGSTMDTGNFY